MEQHGERERERELKEARGRPSMEKRDHERDSQRSSQDAKEVDELELLSFHEKNAGRLVLDPEEARVEFGEKFASRLKLSEDGTKVLWPQPTDDPRDPQNWSSNRKMIQLIIVTLAAIIPDFDNGIGIASVFELAKQYKTSTGVINNISSNWSIFLVGWGGLFAVMLMRRYGRLPVLFWSQVIALALLVLATFAPNLKSFAAGRATTAFFGTTPQVTGLYVITDMYPFHLQARKLNIWSMGFIVSPHVSPFAFGFLVARQNWRWAYGAGCLYSLAILLLIAFLGEETLYDRTVQPIPHPPPARFMRLRTLLGITGAKMARYRASWRTVIVAPFKIAWRPHLVGALLFEAMLFGFGIGINVTNAVFFGAPPPVGFGFSDDVRAGLYATPIIAVFLGELIGRWLNDWIMEYTVRRNQGVFWAESRLWACYLAMPLYICGLITLGGAIQHHLSPAAVIIGWGLAQIAIMVNTVAIYAYCSDSFPRHQGEVSMLVNLARTLGGFAVAYFQVPWATKHGALQTFGVEAAIVSALFLMVVPLLQLKGASLRARYSPQ